MSEVELNPLLDFLAGTISGIAGLVVGYPFDTVKVRFQNPEMTGKYRSTMHALATIIKEERFIGMYKGITSPLATAALMNGLVFASYRFFMKIQLENSSSIPTLTQIALAGAGSGIVSSIVTTPTELIKIRQQSLLVPSSTYEVAMDILRRNGIRGLYRGIGATALRDLGYGSYFLR
ncbi:mitochondrial carrier domain-containing protein [Desarmillaria tabescens]|uniref:Mitochondrial carrier domain-containing protein n=1 Tax=Armillaria tabescens TaxID=1929756 RepID=A0AA39MZT8_ARMTA|nr:mitochondrial carrier domain-containing protein [Desarmillaria tabescens]KAK0452747.1 mitochondrial carrier domain-containing protein [Desarmillaria tabescens]